jgi:hypothetical protein
MPYRYALLRETTPRYLLCRPFLSGSTHSPSSPPPKVRLVDVSEYNPAVEEYRYVVPRFRLACQWLTRGRVQDGPTRSDDVLLLCNGRSSAYEPVGCASPGATRALVFFFLKAKRTKTLLGGFSPADVGCGRPVAKDIQHGIVVIMRSWLSEANNLLLSSRSWRTISLERKRCALLVGVEKNT